MIDKVKIIKKHLDILYENIDEINMNISINNSLESPVQENADELNRYLSDCNDQVRALEEELSRVLLEIEVSV